MSEAGSSSAGQGAPGADKPQAMKPRDSSTLIIVDAIGGEPRILMGKRRMDQVFMPGKYVFPGGRVDAADRGLETVDELHEADTAKLLVEMRDTPSAGRARAIALAAVRETFEETGLLVGAPGAPSKRVEAEAWRGFYERGYMPKLSQLRFFARAITPPGRPRRYDSRFFYADVSAVALRTDVIDGELSSLDWFTFDEMRALDLPAITRVVLEDLIDRLKLDLEGGEAAAAAAAVPFYRHKGGASRRQLLELP
jgi:8-oxo-dGTP pyrophosphatase MutT (NUDIX family)